MISKVVSLNGKLAVEVASSDELTVMKDGATVLISDADTTVRTFQLAANTVTSSDGTVTAAPTLLASSGVLYFLM